MRVGLLESPFVAAADLILSATGDPSFIYLPISLFACSRYLLLNSVQPLLPPYPVLPTILLAHSDAFLILASEDWLENEPPDDPPPLLLLESLLLNGLNIFWNIVAISDKVPNNPPSFFAGELPPELPETL